MKRVLGSVLTLVSVVTLSGCDQKILDMDPQEVLRKMTVRMLEVETSSFEGEVNLEAGGANEGVDLEIKMKGRSDKSDEDNQKSEVEMEVEGKITGPETEFAGGLKFEMVQMGQEMFFKLESLDLEGEEAVMINQLVSMFLGQWFKIGADMLPLVATGFLESNDEQKALMNEVRKLASETDFFKLEKDHGIEQMGGEETVHFSVRLDRDGAKKFLQLVGMQMGTVIPDADLAQLDVMLDSLTEGIDLWIDTDDFDVMKMQMALVGQFEGEDGDADFDMRVEVEMSDHGEKMQIEEPEGAQDFNPLMMMGGLGGMEGLEGMGEL